MRQFSDIFNIYTEVLVAHSEPSLWEVAPHQVAGVTGYYRYLAV